MNEDAHLESYWEDRMEAADAIYDDYLADLYDYDEFDDGEFY